MAMTPGQRFPIRLMMHFQPARTPLVQVTDGVLSVDGQLHGAGTRAVDITDGARMVDLRDPMTGRSTGGQISIVDALAAIAALAYDVKGN
jgi:hypothetical protein